MGTDNLETYIIGLWIISWFGKFKKKIHIEKKKITPLTESLVLQLSWEAESPGSKCQGSSAELLPAPIETQRAKLPEQPWHSQRTFRNYNRSCWLLHSCKSGPYLTSDSYKVTPKLLSCSNFSFNQLRSQFSPWYRKTASVIWGARCAKSPWKKNTTANTHCNVLSLNSKVWVPNQSPNCSEDDFTLAGSVPNQILPRFPPPPLTQTSVLCRRCSHLSSWDSWTFFSLNFALL